ncbi:15119_t:CDS:2, partial [Gigaspora margarita]
RECARLDTSSHGVTVDDITVRKHGEEIGLRPGLVVDRSFINDDETPLQIIVNAPATLKRKHEKPGDLEKIMETVVDKALSRLKSPETIQVSSFSESKAKMIIEYYGITSFKVSEDFDPIESISCAEISEDRQMSRVEKWFKDSLNLPRGFHIKDVHTQNYQRNLQTANTILTGGTDISIGPSATSCIWIETNKNKESFKLGQAIGELLIMDNEYAPRPMSVLTDCNDNWVIFFFMEAENQEHYLASSIINDHSIALAIIKQFVLDEGRAFLDMLGKTITYQTNLPEPLKKRTKFLPPISEKNDERMGDIIDDMTEKELRNMTMRKKLKLAKSIVRIEEHPIIDQLIGQFSDDYESSMYV